MKKFFRHIGACIPAVIIFTFCILPAYAQDASAIMKRYSEAIAKIELLSYNVNRVDTFTNGSVWNNKGFCHFRRLPQNKLLGFAFSGKRSDLPSQSWYDGQYYFNIDHDKKSYGVTYNPSRGILGHPGGQMVAQEFLIADTGITSMSVVETPDHYILRLNFPDNKEHDITNNYKLLHLDKKTYLPQSIIACLNALDKKQVCTKYFSDVVINSPATMENMRDKESLASYELKVPQDKNELEVLIGKPAPDFALESFTGQKVNLQNMRGKLVLLDFWEVWCGPCVQSMPKIQAMHEKYAGKGLVILGVTIDRENYSSNKLFVQKKQFTFPNLLGNEQTRSGYKVNAIPEYILIDKEGKVILAQAGFTDDIEKIIKEKLGE